MDPLFTIYNLAPYCELHFDSILVLLLLLNITQIFKKYIDLFSI
jgi:hypothetical protein